MPTRSPKAPTARKSTAQGNALESPAPKARHPLAQANGLGAPQKNGSSPEGAKQAPLALHAPGQRQLVPATLDHVLGPPNPDAEMGVQITEQYHRATGGMIEVLKFGAMMMTLESALDQRAALAPRVESKHKGSGRYAKGSGVKAWLAINAPQVNEGTAYRFKHVAEAIAEESYEQLVGSKVAKQFALPALVTTPAAELPEKVRSKQLELFEFVSGTSQRSWLDRFKPETTPGGPTYERTAGKGERKGVTADEARTFLHGQFLQAGKANQFVHKEKAFTVANAAERHSSIALLKARLAEEEAWDKLTGKEREEALTELLDRHTKPVVAARNQKKPKASKGKAVAK